MTYFTADFFRNNRAELRKRVRTQPIVITANGSMQRAADEPYKFIQDSNFWYLTGLTTSDLILVMYADQEFLIAPELSVERRVFDGSVSTQILSERSGVPLVLGEREGWQRLNQFAATHKSIATLLSPPPFMERHRLYALPFRRRLISKIKRAHPGVAITDIRAELASMRCIKQAPELLAIQTAIDITSETLVESTQRDILELATHEYQLEAAITHGFRYRGADGHAFEPIVGAGPHSTTLHHVDNNGVIATGDLIVLDVGASVEHYAADITRTVAQQKPSARQQAVFDAVMQVQQDALTLLKPGIQLADYEHRVSESMGKQLRALNLIIGNDAAAIRHYFPHSTSHFLGLDTHDVGNYQLPLAKNMVLTCEPGIYIPEENIGVRIEDDVLITETGNRVLSTACPVDVGFVQ